MWRSLLAVVGLIAMQPPSPVTYDAFAVPSAYYPRSRSPASSPAADCERRLDIPVMVYTGEAWHARTRTAAWTPMTWRPC